MSATTPSPVSVLAAGRDLALGLVARLAFWTAVAFPAVYVAVHLRYGFGSLGSTALVALVAGNALAVVVGHRHAADAGTTDDAADARPARDADETPAVAPVGGD